MCIGNVEWASWTTFFGVPGEPFKLLCQCWNSMLKMSSKWPLGTQKVYFQPFVLETNISFRFTYMFSFQFWWCDISLLVWRDKSTPCDETGAMVCWQQQENSSIMFWSFRFLAFSCWWVDGFVVIQNCRYILSIACNLITNLTASFLLLFVRCYYSLFSSNHSIKFDEME